MTKKIYIVAGPTASGKSAFAVQLAHQVHGQIINADSLQVYADIPILSAQPDQADLQTVPHHLYGFLDTYQTLNVAQWLTYAKKVINTIDTPIFVGGTGMYLYALENGLTLFPDIPNDIRQAVRAMPLAAVREKLPTYRFTDDQRLRRALEVLLATGKPIEYYQNQPPVKVIQGDFEKFLLLPPRDVLYARCEKRFYAMWQAGAPTEVQKLLAKKPTGGVLKAIGIAPIQAYLAGQMTKDQAIATCVLQTRHYAKRQYTWFQHKFRAQHVITGDALA